MTPADHARPASHAYALSGWAALRIALVPVLITVVVGVAARSVGDPLAVLGTFSTRFLGIFVEAAPFLLLGSLTSGLIEVFLNRDQLARLVPRNRALAAVAGAFLGFAFPVCECGVVPVTRRLFSKGLPISVGVAFLLASPVMNPIVLLSTWSAFGFGPVLVGRYLITAVVAIGVGLVFALVTRPRDVLRSGSMVGLPSPVGGGEAPESGERHDLHTPVLARPVVPPGPHRGGPGEHHQHPRERDPAPLTARLGAALALASDEFFDMGKYLIVGSLLAAGMQTVVSQDALTALGRGPITSVVTLQALAYLLSVCSTVDAFLALAFRGTFTTASILAFLTFGPMVDIKSTLMFLGVFQPRIVAYLILLPLLMTMAIGIWLNLNVPL